MRSKPGLFIFLVGIALVLAQSVYAHAAYERSHPGDGAVLSTAPERVDIWFTQELFRRQGENWIRVFGPDGAAVHDGEAQIEDDDRSHMGVALQEGLAPGQYRVEWRTLSAEDGDTDEGTFTFTVDPQAAVTSTPMLQATATAPPTTVPQETATPSATVVAQEPASPGAGSTCFLGLLPLLSLVLLTGMAAGDRRP